MKAKGRDGGGFILKKKTFNTPILYKQELSEKPFKNTHISNFPTLKLWKVDTLPQETFQSTLPHTVLGQEHKTKENNPGNCLVYSKNCKKHADCLGSF